MANFTLNMGLSGRPAIYTPCVSRPQFSLTAYEPVEVEVLGLYQVLVDSDIDAYFVVVLPTGKCTYAGVDQIQFTDCGVPTKDGDAR